MTQFYDYILLENQFLKVVDGSGNALAVIGPGTLGTGPSGVDVGVQIFSAPDGSQNHIRWEQPSGTITLNANTTTTSNTQNLQAANGDIALNSDSKVIKLQNIDGLTSSSITIGTTSASWGSFVLINAFAIPTNIVGTITVPLNITAGITGPSYTDLITPTMIGGIAPIINHPISCNINHAYTIVPAGSSIILEVLPASGPTTFTFDIYIQGFYTNN